MSLYDEPADGSSSSMEAAPAPLAVPAVTAAGELVVPEYAKETSHGHCGLVATAAAAAGHEGAAAGHEGAADAPMRGILATSGMATTSADGDGVDAICFNIQRRAVPLIVAHFIHYNAWAVASIPFNYAINAVACEAHTENACALGLTWMGVLNFTNPAVQLDQGSFVILHSPCSYLYRTPLRRK
jgi:hypothetical protein